MVRGGGHSRLEVVGVLVMIKASFANTEKDIGEWWEQELQKSMAKEWKEKKQLAMSRDDYHKRVLAITVIMDGEWSKHTGIPNCQLRY